jgi:hypothetical protein
VQRGGHMEVIRNENQRALRRIAVLCSMLVVAHAAVAKCPSGVDPKASSPLGTDAATSGCEFKSNHGYALPDPRCTPGAINPTVTLAVLQATAKTKKFTTSCDRDVASSASAKAAMYGAYSDTKPMSNKGQAQTCELDHLVSLELGGADTLDNIWPQCGPAGVILKQRYFKIKDSVENYLAVQVKMGDISLESAQHGIATDWTQYIDAATSYWASHTAKGFGRDSS